jgi:hypothetical protein
MSALLERYAKQAVLFEQQGRYEPVASMRVARDLDLLMSMHKQTWKRRQLAILDSGDPYMMPEGTYAGVLAYPPAQTVTTTSINGTVNLWDNGTYSPVTKNSVLGPQVYRVALPAKITTAATPANIGFNPLINTTSTWTTGGTAVSGGSTLGATANIALTASITNAFYLVIGDLTIRNAGTSSVIVALLHYTSTQGTSGGLAGPAAVGTGHNLMFGGTAVTVDTQTGAQTFQLGSVHTVTTITHSIEQIHFMDWN